MSQPVVLYVVQPSNAIVPTYEMRWGGSHRLSFWHLQSLSRCGLQLHVVAPAGSRLDLPDADVVISAAPGLLSVSVDEHEAALAQWTEDVVTTIARVEPDLILLQGPDVKVLQAIPEAYRAKSVFCSHYHFNNQPLRRDWLLDHAEISITAVSALHREDMPDALRERAMVTRAGVPVRTYRPRPRVERPVDPALASVADAFDRSGGRLVSQVDRLSPDKSQRAAVQAFLASDLPADGWVFVVGGDEFINGVPAAVAPDDARVRYNSEVAELALNSNGSVLVLGPLEGHEVEEVYGASAAVIAPFGLDLPGYREAFGLAPAIAQSVGTPVLASHNIDASIVEHGVSGWRFADQTELVAALNALPAHAREPHMRTAVRQWAAEHQGLKHMVTAYADLISERAAAVGKHWELTPDALHQGLEAVDTGATRPSLPSEHEPPARHSGHEPPARHSGRERSEQIRNPEQTL